MNVIFKQLSKTSNGASNDILPPTSKEFRWHFFVADFIAFKCNYKILSEHCFKLAPYGLKFF